MRLVLALLLPLALLATPCMSAPEVAMQPEKLPGAPKMMYKQLFPNNPAQVDAPSGMYDLDRSHASIIFKVSHLGFSYYTGRFDNLHGELKFDAKRPKDSAIRLTIDPASVDTNNKELEDSIKGDGLFNVAKFPSIRFESTGVKPTVRDAGIVKGDVSWMGMIKPINVDVRFNGSGKHPMTGKKTIGFTATTTLKRSDFGLTKWEPDVGDEVQIIAEMEFTKR